MWLVGGGVCSPLVALVVGICLPWFSRCCRSQRCVAWICCLACYPLTSQVLGGVWGSHSPCPCLCVGRCVFLGEFTGLCWHNTVSYGELTQFVTHSGCLPPVWSVWRLWVLLVLASCFFLNLVLCAAEVTLRGGSAAVALGCWRAPVCRRYFGSGLSFWKSWSRSGWESHLA